MPVYRGQEAYEAYKARPWASLTPDEQLAWALAESAAYHASLRPATTGEPMTIGITPETVVQLTLPPMNRGNDEPGRLAFELYLAYCRTQGYGLPMSWGDLTRASQLAWSTAVEDTAMRAWDRKPS